VPASTLTGWLAAEYLWVFTRYLQWRAFGRVQPATTQISRWRLQTWLGSAINGLIYGVGGIILFVPGSLSSQFLLLIVEFGMGSGAVFAWHRPCPRFCSTSIRPCSSRPCRSSLPGDTVHVTLAVSMLMFIAATTHFAIGISRSIRKRGDTEIRKPRPDRGVAGSQRGQVAVPGLGQSRTCGQPLHALGFL